MNSVLAFRTISIQPICYRGSMWHTSLSSTLMLKKKRNKRSNRRSRYHSLLLSPRHYDSCMRLVASASAKRLFDGSEVSSVKGDLRDLKAALNEAVALEDYFLAAQLRDEIKELENQDPVLNMKKMMEEAVRAEDYETAVKIRDELRCRTHKSKIMMRTSHEYLQSIPCSSESVTNDIRVKVRSFYVNHLSVVEEGKYVFAYQVEIVNESDRTVQLKKREWTITDGNGNIEKARGRGVIGQEPVLSPGQYFQYMSVCPLHTPIGQMEGMFEMRLLDGFHHKDNLQVKIAKFGLSINIQGRLA